MRSQRSAGGRAGRRGSRGAAPPIARRWKKIPARACRSNGPGPRTISALRSGVSASGRAGRRGSRRDALEAADGALEEFRAAKADFYIAKAERQRGEILAAKGKL